MAPSSAARSRLPHGAITTRSSAGAAFGRGVAVGPQGIGGRRLSSAVAGQVGGVGPGPVGELGIVDHRVGQPVDHGVGQAQLLLRRLADRRRPGGAGRRARPGPATRGRAGRGRWPTRGLVEVGRPAASSAASSPSASAAPAVASCHCPSSPRSSTWVRRARPASGSPVATRTRPRAIERVVRVEERRSGGTRGVGPERLGLGPGRRRRRRWRRGPDAPGRRTRTGAAPGLRRCPRRRRRGARRRPTRRSDRRRSSAMRGARRPRRTSSTPGDRTRRRGSRARSTASLASP